MSEEIDLKDLLSLIIKGYKLTLLLVIIGAFFAYKYSEVTYNPMYSTTASMIVNSKQIKLMGNDVVLTNDVTLSQKLVNTYRVILLSDNIMEKVSEKLDKKFEPAEIRRWVSVSSPNETEVIVVSVSNKDPQLAADVANLIMEVAPSVIEKTIEVGSINIVDYAKVPLSPQAKQNKLHVVIGSVIGGMFGVFLSLLKQFIWPKINFSKDVNTQLGLTLLGKISFTKNMKKKRGSAVLNDLSEIHYVEAIKVIALNLISLSTRFNYKTFMFTSCSAKEGKTTTSLNLAIYLNRIGKSVIFIDCDFYKDFFHSRCNQRRDLKDVLNGNCSYKEAMIRDQESKLHILPSGCLGKDSIELIHSSEMNVLIEELKDIYDYIIIDAPPINPVSDALYLSQMVDGVILVIRQNFEMLNRLISVKESLIRVDANIIGSILTGAKKSSAKLNNSYHYELKRI